VFGNDWPDAGKIDNNEKAKREIKIRDRMVVKMKPESWLSVH